MEWQRGKVVEKGGIATRLNRIRELTQEESYRLVVAGICNGYVPLAFPHRYLGVEQLLGPRTSKTRQIVGLTVATIRGPQ